MSGCNESCFQSNIEQLDSVTMKIIIVIVVVVNNNSTLKQYCLVFLVSYNRWKKWKLFKTKTTIPGFEGARCRRGIYV